MKRYQYLFHTLSICNEGAFIPFAILCDPNFDISIKIIKQMIHAGADALELGIPFSDPVADGIVIQNASLRALAAKGTLTRCFQIIKMLRNDYPIIPIGILIYANLIFNHGIDVFFHYCSEVGIDSVLVVDVPLEESAPFRYAAMQHDVTLVFICPPNADHSLLREIAFHSRDYIYLLSRPGVTGHKNRNFYPVAHLIETLIQYQSPPILQGFGISEPRHIQSALNAGAAGAISGSAIISIIEKYIDTPSLMLQKLSTFISSMKKATLIENR